MSRARGSDLLTEPTASASRVKPDGLNKPRPDKNYSAKILPIFECLTVFGLSCLVNYFHVFWSGTPYLTLLFDSTGYLWIADGLTRVWTDPLSAQAVLHYVSTGFNETVRLQLAQSWSPIADICKAGPVLPMLLATCYTLAGKAATSQNWNIAASLMCITTAAVTPILWLWGNKLGGKKLARVAAVLALSYPGFVANSGRILSELPAVSLCTLSLFVIYCCLTDNNRGIDRMRCDLKATPQGYAGLELGGSPASALCIRSIAIGASIAIIMLARPPLLLLPLLLVAAVGLVLLCLRNNRASAGGVNSVVKEGTEATYGVAEGWSSVAADHSLNSDFTNLVSIEDNGKNAPTTNTERAILEQANETSASSRSDLFFQNVPHSPSSDASVPNLANLDNLGGRGKTSRSIGVVYIAACIIIGAGIVLAPWSACKFVLTGKPSITVDRYGAYNLWTGCNPQNNGWDVLPSTLVTHPEQFNKTLSEVIVETGRGLQKNLPEYIELMLQKPGRMLAAPWNDFQNTCLGVDWTLQRLWHQFILLAALLGLFSLVQSALAMKHRNYAIFVALAGSMISYHAINMLFITMNRYFIVAMPEVILLAAVGLLQLRERGQNFSHATARLQPAMSKPALSNVLKETSAPIPGDFLQNSSDTKERFWIPACGITLFLVTSAVSQVLPESELGRVAASLLGPQLFIFVYAAVVSLSLSAGVYMLLRRASGNKFLKLLTLGLCAVMVATVFTSAQIDASERTTSRFSTVDKTLIANVPSGTKSAPPAVATNWFIVVDGARNGAVELNGRIIGGQWRPLWAMRPDFRENLTYLASFAYSSQKGLENCNGWWCIPVPSGLLKKNGSNEIRVLNDSKPIACDYSRASVLHGPLSLDRFSWTKGFFVDHPGEMRMFQRDGQPPFETMQEAQVRAYLVGSNTRVEPIRTMSPIIISQPHAEVGTSPATRIKNCELVDSRLATIDTQLVALQVSGRVRAARNKACASICLLERIEQKGNCTEEFSPLAPQSIPVANEWKAFQFVDYVPLGRDRKLSSLRLLLGGRPWWEILSYNSSKGKAKLEFEDIKIEIKPEPALSSFDTVIPLSTK